MKNMSIDIEQINQILNTELGELKSVHLPYAIEFNRHKEGINNKIRQHELALEKLENLTQTKIDEYAERCNIEGMSISLFVINVASDNV